jgi:hypothetical protein
VAWAFVKSSGNQAVSASASLAVAYGSPVAATNLLAAFCLWNSTTQTCSVSDSVNGAWTPDPSSLGVLSSPGFSGQWFYCPSTAAGTPTVTMTCSGSNAERELMIHEYSGLDKTAPRVDSSSATGPSGVPTVNVTLSQAGQCVLGGSFLGLVTTVGAGFTGRVNANDNLSEEVTSHATAAGTLAVIFGNGGGAWIDSAIVFAEPGVTTPVMPPTFNAIPFTGVPNAGP